LLLAAMGGAVGALASRWLSDGLLSLATAGPTLALQLASDGRLLGVVAALALGAAVVLGLVPAWHGSAGGLAQAMRTAAASVSSGVRRRLASRLLLTSQVACSLVLLVGAGLLAGSLGRLRQSHKGFDEDSVLLVTLSRNLPHRRDRPAGESAPPAIPVATPHSANMRPASEFSARSRSRDSREPTAEPF
jgi:putative ABC transport system permease protein